MKQIFPRYIHKMYYYLLSMSDDDLDDFHINDESYRAKLFDEMKADFDTYGPVSKQRVLEAIEHILSSGEIDKLWGYVVPQELLLDEVEDKRDYLRALYQRLVDHEPPQRDFGPDVQLERSAGPHGIDVRL
jgi:hypothetical protein